MTVREYSGPVSSAHSNINFVVVNKNIELKLCKHESRMISINY